MVPLRTWRNRTLRGRRLHRHPRPQAAFPPRGPSVSAPRLRCRCLLPGRLLIRRACPIPQRRTQHHRPRGPRHNLLRQIGSRTPSLIGSAWWRPHSLRCPLWFFPFSWPLGESRLTTLWSGPVALRRFWTPAAAPPSSRSPNCTAWRGCRVLASYGHAPRLLASSRRLVAQPSALSRLSCCGCVSLVCSRPRASWCIRCPSRCRPPFCLDGTRCNRWAQRLTCRRPHRCQSPSPPGPGCCYGPKRSLRLPLSHRRRSRERCVPGFADSLACRTLVAK